MWKKKGAYKRIQSMVGKKASSKFSEGGGLNFGKSRPQRVQNSDA